MSVLTDDQCLARSTIDRMFIIGPDFKTPQLNVKATPAEAIAMTTKLTGTGYLWMQYLGGYALVGNYGPKGVFNGQAQCVPAKPEDFIFFAHHRD